MPMTDQEARDRLAALVRIPGELRLIRPVFIPELRADPGNETSKPPVPGPDASDDEVREYNALLRRPSSHVQRNIVAIEPHPVNPAYVVAKIAEDDSHIAGLPVDVLARCRQWESEG